MPRSGPHHDPYCSPYLPVISDISGYVQMIVSVYINSSETYVHDTVYVT